MRAQRVAMAGVIAAVYGALTFLVIQFELLWLLTVPAAAGIIALATARLSVLAALRGIH